MSKKPIIAVDRDDVLALHYKAITTFMAQNHGLKLPTAYHSDFPRLWDIDVARAESLLWDFNRAGVHGDFELVPHAVEVINHLHQTYDMVIVSSQIKQNFAAVEAWILKHFPGLFDQIIFLHTWEGDIRTKAGVCLEVGAQYLIEDRLKNVLQASEAGITTLLFGGYEGTDIELPNNVVPVTDWLEVKEYFDRKPSSSVIC